MRISSFLKLFFSTLISFFKPWTRHCVTSSGSEARLKSRQSNIHWLEISSLHVVMEMGWKRSYFFHMSHFLYFLFFLYSVLKKYFLWCNFSFKANRQPDIVGCWQLFIYFWFLKLKKKNLKHRNFSHIFFKLLDN